jgi:hypothetical protein
LRGRYVPRPTFQRPAAGVFREFLELFYPDVAARLDFSRVTFLDKEMFTDVPEGSQRELDLVAEVYTLDGEPELVYLHLEVEAERRRTFPHRMFEYYALLRLRRKSPVFPVVVYLSPGAGGLTQETYTETLFGREILTFRYECVGLPDLSADDYLEVDNLLAPGLSALMKTSRLGRTFQKIISIRRTVERDLDEARKALLLNIIETYLKLSETEEEEFRRMISQEESQEVRQVLTVYEVRGMHKVLLKMMRAKFGELPEDVVAKVQAIQDEAELGMLTERAVKANSLEEIGLSEN